MVWARLVDPNGFLGGVLGARMAMSLDGRFSFSGVPPGQYLLTACSCAPGLSATAGANSSAPLRWATQTVNVTGPEPLSIRLTLQAGVRIAGRAVFDGVGSPIINVAGLTVHLNPSVTTDSAGAMGGQGSGPVAQDGQFTITNVIPGLYRVSTMGLFGRQPVSVDVGGKDALDFLLDVEPGKDVSDLVVTMSNRTTEIQGTVRDSTGHVVPGFMAIAFAQDERYWTPQSRRIQAARTSTDGGFSLQGLPAGDYRLVAVSDVEPGAWFGPAFLRQVVGQSIGVTLSLGDRKVQDLRLAK
jgi:hypothetical protein